MEVAIVAKYAIVYPGYFQLSIFYCLFYITDFDISFTCKNLDRNHSSCVQCLRSLVKFGSAPD